MEYKLPSKTNNDSDKDALKAFANNVLIRHDDYIIGGLSSLYSVSTHRERYKKIPYRCIEIVDLNKLYDYRYTKFVGKFAVKSNHIYIKDFLMSCSTYSIDSIVGDTIEEDDIIPLFFSCNSFALLQEKRAVLFKGFNDYIPSDEQVKDKVTTSFTGRYISVVCPFSSILYAYLASLKSSQYSATTRTWTFRTVELNKLIENIEINKQSYPLVDFSQLYELKDLLNSIHEGFTLSSPDYNRFTRTPTKLQIEGCEFILNHRKALIADVQGLGKTGTSLLASVAYLNKFPSQSVLIICPKNSLGVWQREIRLMGINLTHSVHTVDNFIYPANYIIVSFEGFIKYYDVLFNQIRPSFVIVDEAHKMRRITPSGKPRAKITQYILDFLQSAYYIVLLTGTPITNGNSDLFNLLLAIDSELSLNFMDYVVTYCDAKRTAQGLYIGGSSNCGELNKHLSSCMLRRLKGTDLPTKERKFIPCNVDLKNYRKLLNEYIDAIRKTVSNRVMPLLIVNRMKVELARQKVPCTIDYANRVLQLEPKIVIFTQFHECLHRLVDFYGESCVYIIGGMSNEERDIANEQFQNNPTIKVMICTITAGCVSRTFTASRIVLFNDMSWIATELQQAEDRVHRIGQTKDCYIYYLYCEGASIDAKLIEYISYKSAVANSTLDNGLFDEFTLKLDISSYILDALKREAKIKTGADSSDSSLGDTVNDLLLEEKENEEDYTINFAINTLTNGVYADLLKFTSSIIYCFRVGIINNFWHVKLYRALNGNTPSFVEQPQTEIIDIKQLMGNCDKIGNKLFEIALMLEQSIKVNDSELFKLYWQEFINLSETDEEESN